MCRHTCVCKELRRVHVLIAPTIWSNFNVHVCFPTETEGASDQAEKDLKQAQFLYDEARCEVQTLTEDICIETGMLKEGIPFVCVFVYRHHDINRLLSK